MCLQAIARFSIAGLIPSGAQVSFAAIAEKTGLSEQIVACLLRHAMTMQFFHEPQLGMLAHTQASKILASPVTNGWLNIAPETIRPAVLGVRLLCVANLKLLLGALRLK